jgi:hypothetical protein
VVGADVVVGAVVGVVAGVVAGVVVGVVELGAVDDGTNDVGAFVLEEGIVVVGAADGTGDDGANDEELDDASVCANAGPTGSAARIAPKTARALTMDEKRRRDDNRWPPDDDAGRVGNLRERI